MSALRVESRLVGGDDVENNVRIFRGRKLIADLTDAADTSDIVAAFMADEGEETEPTGSDRA